jgi:hypothetical protein
MISLHKLLNIKPPRHTFCRPSKYCSAQLHSAPIYKILSLHAYENHHFVSSPYLLEGKIKMEVEIISKECIKPSSPTPPSLKTYKLSLLDQVVPSAYIPMIFFYPMNKSISHSVVDIVSQRSHLLKQSLSNTLTRFYPFAGKIKKIYIYSSLHRL